MYTSFIGKQFLKIYNNKTASDYTAERFFEEKFFPIFFNDERHLMHVGNSPFFQKPKKEDVTKHGTKPLAQFENLKTKISKDEPNMSFFVGYAASGTKESTSGQVTSLEELAIEPEEIYASWIGQALAVGVSGGNVFLLNEDEVLWQLYLGWSVYRKYIDQTNNVKDKQIETWNGQWINFILSDDRNKSEFPDLPTSKALGKLAISTISWSKVLFSLSHLIPQKEVIIYAYGLSQMNTTLGFIKIFLPEFNKLIEYRYSLIDFKEFNELDNREIENFETFYNFRVACQRGNIGLNALEPKGLRQYMPKGSVLYAQGKEFNFNNENDYFLYELYQNWIMATLNKTKLLELASDLAGYLKGMEEEKTDRGKSAISRVSQEIRESKTVKAFIEKLTEALPLMDDDIEATREIVKVVLEMPSDNFPLFITLVRFEYNYLINLKQ